MTTTKIIDNKRRSHAAKVLAQASKKNQVHEHHETSETSTEGNSNTASMETSENAETLTSTMTDVRNTLNEQYSVIREDVLKLREDLAHGYDIIKEVVDTKLNIRSLLRLSK